MLKYLIWNSRNYFRFAPEASHFWFFPHFVEGVASFHTLPLATSTKEFHLSISSYFCKEVLHRDFLHRKLIEIVLDFHQKAFCFQKFSKLWVETPLPHRPLMSYTLQNFRHHISCLSPLSKYFFFTENEMCSRFALKGFLFSKIF